MFFIIFPISDTVQTNLKKQTSSNIQPDLEVNRQIPVFHEILVLQHFSKFQNLLFIPKQFLKSL